MYTSFTGTQNLTFLKSAFEALELELGRQGYRGGFWVCYGSFILNTQKLGSDIDLLYIHELSMSPCRIQSVYEGYPVTIYCVSREDFAQDGASALYGGYFSGKILNPYHNFSTTPETQTLLEATGGAFIAPYTAMMATRHNRTIHTAENVLADSVLARFHLCPWYASYFLRYFTLQNFPVLWEKMKEHMLSFLLEAHAIEKKGEGYIYTHTPSPTAFHEGTIAAAGRFWTAGSHFHENIPDFTGFYIQKASQYIEANNLSSKMEAMLGFLAEQSAI